MTRFTAFGVPAPKGSTKAFWRPGMKHAVVTHDSKRTKPWCEAVKEAALTARGDALPIEEPVAVFVRFFMPRPKSTAKRITQHAKKPDLDKLLRSTKDALKDAGLYRDDALVVLAVASKHFAAWQDDPHGARGIPRAEVEVGIYSEAQVIASWPSRSAAQRSA